MTVASIATVSACIFIVSLSYCLISNLSSILEQIENKIGVVVFLEDGLTSEDVSRINDDINAIDNVAMVVYVSPEEALSSLKQEWEADDILRGFSGENNPLPHAFEISLESIERQGQVLTELEGLSGIRKIRHAQAETEMLLQINNGVSIAGIVMVVILAIISIVIIMNTIKISVYTRRNEINIMKFVGATDWFIRWPFIIEGALIGVLGAAIPMAASWPLYTKIISVIYGYIGDMVILRNGYVIFSVLIPVSLVVGAFLGIFGSVSSIRKHLKV